MIYEVAHVVISKSDFKGRKWQFCMDSYKSEQFELLTMPTYCYASLLPS